MRPFIVSVFSFVLLFSVFGCSSQLQVSQSVDLVPEHMGCQESEVRDGACVPSHESNVMMFGKEHPGVVTEEVPLGYLARPSAPGVYPGVVMIHEWWGLNDNIKEMARILADEGYVVLAIDLYGEVAYESEDARRLATAVRSDPSAAVEKMKSAVSFLRESFSVPKVASLGWCFGGQQSLNLALNDQLDATVIYYGQLIDDKEQLKNIRWPVLGIFGDQDQSISVESVESFSSALEDLGTKNEIHIYPGVGHAFANPSGTNYAPEETMDAWQRTVSFLDENLR